MLWDLATEKYPHNIQIVAYNIITVLSSSIPYQIFGQEFEALLLSLSSKLKRGILDQNEKFKDSKVDSRLNTIRNTFDNIYTQNLENLFLIIASSPI
jgi:hypothetical protein